MTNIKILVFLTPHPGSLESVNELGKQIQIGI